MDVFSADGISGSDNIIYSTAAVYAMPRQLVNNDAGIAAGNFAFEPNKILAAHDIFVFGRIS